MTHISHKTYEPLFIVGHPIIINVLILRRWLNILKTPFGRVVSNIVPRFIYDMEAKSLLNKFKPSKTTHNYLYTNTRECEPLRKQFFIHDG